VRRPRTLFRGSPSICATSVALPPSGHVRCKEQWLLWVKSGHVQRKHRCPLRLELGDRTLAKNLKFLSGNDKTKLIPAFLTGRPIYWMCAGYIDKRQFAPARVSGRPSSLKRLREINVVGTNMRKKTSLHYELYGSATGGGKKGLWRWAIFAGREKKPLLVGSFYGALPDAQEHAEEAISRLKERVRTHKAPRSR
jgi:hypothetical protein